jgi:hypothetical protein
MTAKMKGAQGRTEMPKLFDLRLKLGDRLFKFEKVQVHGVGILREIRSQLTAGFRVQRRCNGDRSGQADRGSDILTL